MREISLEQDLLPKWFAVVIVVLVLSGTAIAVVQIVGNKPTLTIQTTTSMNDSGLLDLLKPAFEAKYRCTMRWVAVGTGQALTNAALGQADVVVVHSATNELAFINHTNPAQTNAQFNPPITYAGNGIFRLNFAYNYFVIVGPTSDPLGISGSGIAGNATQIFKTIYTYGHANASAIFVSRGDNSGTNTKEISLWKAAKVWNSTTNWPKGEPQPSLWYKSIGKGMGDTLTEANQLLAYTLTDYGTWLKMKDGLTNLKVVSTKSAPDLKNTYSVIAVDPQLHPNANFDLAKKFIYFMCRDAQNILGNYTIAGEPLFYKYVNYAGTSPSGSPLDDVYTGTFGANLANVSYYPASSASCTSCGSFSGIAGTQSSGAW
jgi:tungstate transport system substrate-binding protein